MMLHRQEKMWLHHRLLGVASNNAVAKKTGTRNDVKSKQLRRVGTWNSEALRGYQLWVNSYVHILIAEPGIFVVK
jgi:hypothetical protein